MKCPLTFSNGSVMLRNIYVYINHRHNTGTLSHGRPLHGHQGGTRRLFGPDRRHEGKAPSLAPLVSLVPGSSISWLAPRVKDPGAVEVEEKGGESEVPQLSISQHDYPVVSLSPAQYNGRLLLNAIDMVLICTGKVCNL